MMPVCGWNRFQVLISPQEMRSIHVWLRLVACVMAREHIALATQDFGLAQGRPCIPGISTLVASSDGDGDLVLQDVAQVGTVDGEIDEFVSKWVGPTG